MNFAKGDRQMIATKDGLGSKEQDRFWSIFLQYQSFNHLPSEFCNG